MNTTAFTRIVLAAILAAVSIPRFAGAQCAASNGIAIPTDVFFINLTYSSQVGPPPVGQGIAKWTSNCPGEGTSYPVFRENVPGDLSIHAEFLSGRAPNDGGPCGCERTLVHKNQAREMTGATIRIYQERCDGTICRDTSIDLLAHGYGHALGLTDVLSTSCHGTVMGRPLRNQPSTVPAEVCNMLDSRWSYYDPYQCPNYVPAQECDCFLEGMWPDYCHTPVVVDYGNEGFAFSGRKDPGVWFDFTASASPIHTTWIAPGTKQGFLCRDLTQNAVIDNGRELFGNSTLLLSGAEALNGYEALAELDSRESGGNGDGFIDAGDAAYRHIKVWFDENANGRTDTGELVSIEEAGIAALGTGVTVSDEVDPQGNLLPYWSEAWIWREDGEPQRVDTVDVIFIRIGR